MPPLNASGLWPVQKWAITNLEESLAAGRPRALVQMTTGSGKTFMTCSEVYRLIKLADAKRVLFLVDRCNLGRQTLRDFQGFITPDEGRKLTELYNVQLLQFCTHRPREPRLHRPHAPQHHGEAAGYASVARRPEHRGREIDWQVALRPGQRRRLATGSAAAQAEQRKASIRAKVEHPFLYVKRHFGIARVRYRGLAKNRTRLCLLFGFANLLLAERAAPG